jgi:hypothetical protein
MDEFNAEQRLMVEVMRVTGHPDPESVVRADPLAAAHIGAHMAPVVEKMCDAFTKAAPAIHYFAEQMERARKDARREHWRRIVGWAVSLFLAVIMWVGLYLLVRWAL